ncbi:MAG: isochorismatase family protein [Candidatus Cyclobacteriaceae bacterium M2_1C_046]
MEKLLLIVDVQNQFIPKGKKGKIFCEQIEDLQSEYKHVAISQFINNPDTFWVKVLKWDKMMEGEPSAELAFNPAKNSFIYKNDTFSSINDELLQYLEDNSIDEVHLCGVDTDACILATAYELWDLKIPFKVLIDHCVSSAGDNTHSSAHLLMNKNFGFDIVVSKQE